MVFRFSTHRFGVNKLSLPLSAFGPIWTSENFQTGFASIFYTTSKYFLPVLSKKFRGRFSSTLRLFSNILALGAVTI